MDSPLMINLAAVLNNIPDVVSRFDRDLRYIYVNSAATRVTGIATADYIGKTNCDLEMPEELVVLWNARLRAVFETGDETTFEFAFLGIDGVVHHCHVHAVPERDENGHIVSVLNVSRDITAVKHAEAVAREGEARFRLLANHSTDMISCHAPDGVYRYVSPSCERLLGYRPEELLGHNAYDFFHPDDIDAIRESHEETLRGIPFAFIAYRIRRKDGTYIWFETTSHLIADPGTGDLAEIQCASRDVTSRKQVEETLRESEERYRTVLAALDEGVVLQGTDGRIITANASAERILQRQEEQIRGCTSLDPQWAAIHEDGTPFPGETHPAMIALKTGQPQMDIVMGMPVVESETVWLSVNARPLFRPAEAQVYGVVVSFRDITEHKRIEEQLRYSSLHDPLTGLANRALLVDRLTQTLARLQRKQDARFAVLSLDFDGFKQVNDRLGHQAGDDLLIEAARRLRGSVRASDTVARLGGDEFVVLLETTNELLTIGPVLQRIRSALNKPFLLGSQEHSLSVSIGIVHGTACYESTKEVLRDVDAALYEAKAQGHNCDVIFERGLHAQETAQSEVIAPVQGPLIMT